MSPFMIPRFDQFLVAAVAVVLSFGNACADERIAGKVLGIQDGDTITLLDMELTQHRVRLAMHRKNARRLDTCPKFTCQSSAMESS